ncbi:uncharacterized protein MELLADRAFT_75250 [Melampsora larici-populina 98AG31]|uniref:Uncharacterized protein n=1 Tax=Melampsora larici-populina (strain 98AG31 / pathotype 3-4-7) TaxID=747676 RepID=F4RUJ3_MELLP|nr:uncharacterized protein MELLADRAFT_75250 [Melampsora larici-populina 98AG31]EGG03988.1 hypothetical protein MELLADRAFT_75250 [Melampsora larici-populina 98AG31]
MAFNSNTHDSGLGDQTGQRTHQGLGSEVPGGAHHHGGAKTGEGLGGDYSDQGLGARAGVAAGGVGQTDNITGHGAQHAHGGVGGASSTGNKPGVGDKVKGTFEELKGKITKDPVTQHQGEARKKGDLSGHQQVGLDGY